MVSRWISTSAKGGIEALLPKKRAGRRPNMSYDEADPYNNLMDSGEALMKPEPRFCAKMYIRG